MKSSSTTNCINEFELWPTHRTQTPESMSTINLDDISMDSSSEEEFDLDDLADDMMDEMNTGTTLRTPPPPRPLPLATHHHPRTVTAPRNNANLSSMMNQMMPMMNQMFAGSRNPQVSPPHQDWTELLKSGSYLSPAEQLEWKRTLIQDTVAQDRSSKRRYPPSRSYRVKPHESHVRRTNTFAKDFVMMLRSAIRLANVVPTLNDHHSSTQQSWTKMDNHAVFRELEETGVLSSYLKNEFCPHQVSRRKAADPDYQAHQFPALAAIP